VLRQASEAARQRAWKANDVSAETPTTRVDGLLAVAEGYLRGTIEGGSPVEVVVHVEVDGTGTLADGTVLGEKTTARLQCDAALVEVTGGSDEASARRRRMITTLQRRALRLRDQGCRFPGCTNQRVDGHHDRPRQPQGQSRQERLGLHAERDAATAHRATVDARHRLVRRGARQIDRRGADQRSLRQGGPVQGPEEHAAAGRLPVAAGRMRRPPR
jgi:hypothetical protein